jgi:hypothetical protein
MGAMAAGRLTMVLAIAATLATLGLNGLLLAEVAGIGI